MQLYYVDAHHNDSGESLDLFVMEDTPKDAALSMLAYYQVSPNDVATDVAPGVRVFLVPENVERRGPIKWHAEIKSVTFAPGDLKPEGRLYK